MSERPEKRDETEESEEESKMRNKKSSFKGRKDRKRAEIRRWKENKQLINRTGLQRNSSSSSF